MRKFSTFRAFLRLKLKNIEFKTRDIVVPCVIYGVCCLSIIFLPPNLLEIYPALEEFVKLFEFLPVVRLIAQKSYAGDLAQFYLLYMMVIGFLCALWVFGKLTCKIVKLKLHPYSSEVKSAKHLRYYLITTHKINLRLWLAFVGAFLIYVFYNILFIMGELIAIGRRSNHFIDNAFEMLFFMIHPLMFIFGNFGVLFLVAMIVGIIIDWIKIKKGKLKPTSLFDPKEVFKL